VIDELSVHMIRAERYCSGADDQGLKIKIYGEVSNIVRYSQTDPIG